MTETKKAERSICVVTRHYKEKDDMVVDYLDVQTFETDPAHVKVGYGVTINMGNYESARVDVSVTLPTYVEEIDRAFDRASKIVDKKIVEISDEIRGSK